MRVYNFNKMTKLTPYIASLMAIFFLMSCGASKKTAYQRATPVATDTPTSEVVTEAELPAIEKPSPPPPPPPILLLPSEKEESAHIGQAAKPSIKSGTAEFNIQYAIKGEVDPSVLAARPFRQYLTFTEQTALVKSQNNYATSTELIDMRSGRKGIFETILGKQYLVQENAQLTQSVRPTNETKLIQGMACKKAEGTTASGDKIEVYYTDALGLRYAPVAPVDGFTLGYTITSPKERTHCTLDKLRLQEVDEKKVMPSGKYETLPREELQRRTFKGSLIAFMENAPAQDFAKPDMDGQSVSLSDFRGKAVVVNFWFTACGPCRQEIPKLNEVKERYKDRDVEFLAITYDSPQMVKAFTAQLPFEFRIIPDARDVMDAYKLLMYPTTLVIDRSGNVTKIKEGVTGVIELSTAIDRALY
jgi:peroxiredoxin